MQKQIQATPASESAKTENAPKHPAPQFTEDQIKAKGEVFRAGYCIGQLGPDPITQMLGIKGEASYEAAWAKFLELKPTHNRKKRSGFFHRTCKAVQGALLAPDATPGNAFASRAYYAGQEVARAHRAKEQPNLANISTAAQSGGGLTPNSNQDKDRAKEANQALEGFAEGLAHWHAANPPQEAKDEKPATEPKKRKTRSRAKAKATEQPKLEAPAS